MSWLPTTANFILYGSLGILGYFLYSRIKQKAKIKPADVKIPIEITSKIDFKAKQDELANLRVQVEIEKQKKALKEINK